MISLISDLTSAISELNSAKPDAISALTFTSSRVISERSSANLLSTVENFVSIAENLVSIAENFVLIAENLASSQEMYFQMHQAMRSNIPMSGKFASLQSMMDAVVFVSSERSIAAGILMQHTGGLGIDAAGFDHHENDQENQAT